MSALYTAAELSARLREVAEDPAWSVPLRSCARYAARPDAAETGFAVCPADLSDGAIWDALRDGMVDRAQRPGVPTTRESLLARIAALQACQDETGGAR